ncbi:hypothetical protein JX266_002138 [Neoarthrinium moseri]|nr:hypothetical protein JX266_002138 [Neoarthrinium moseri]
MSQHPQSAKRMRSNTSNVDFTPQTAPALRTRPHHLTAGHGNAHDHDHLPVPGPGPGVGLYTPTVYNASFATIPSTRQDVDYASYVAPAQHNGYPAAAYPDAYDPLPHGNSYTIAYGQPPPTNYNPSHGGYYSPGLVAAAQNGPYSPVTARQSTSAGPETYSPSPIPGSSTGASYTDLQAHSTTPMPQQNLQQQYEDAYGSQPVVHSSANHVQNMSYVDPTVSAQYSHPSIEQPNDNLPAALQSPESSSEEESESDEDAQGETADEAELSAELPALPTPGPALTLNPAPKYKKTSHSEPAKPPDSKCACKKGRGKKKACTSCACSKYGRKCGKMCSCGTACGNPFQDLTAFFGPSARFPKPCDANACFATWLSNQPNIEELDVDLMVDMLLYDDSSWASIRGHTPALKDWEDRWLKAKNSKSKKLKEDRERLEFELLRGALGNCNPNDFHGYWYSFCKGQWVPMDNWEHCRECKACAPSSEWHCEQHGQCTVNRTCAGCTGTATSSYPEMAAYTVTA